MSLIEAAAEQYLLPFQRSIYHVHRDIRDTTAIIKWVEATVAGLTNVGLLLKRVGATVTGSSGWAMIGVAIANPAMRRLLNLVTVIHLQD